MTDIGPVIEARLESFLLDAPLNVQQVLFLRGGENPAWSDAAEVYQRAVEQILIHTGVKPDEEPFAFVGVHAMSLLTSKRNSIGFLVTSKRTLSQFDLAVVGTGPKAQSTLFASDLDPGTLTEELWSNFLSKVDMKIDEGKQIAMHSALAGVLQVVMPELSRAGVVPEIASSSNTISDRIASLGLDPYLFRADEPNKNFQKFIAKYEVQDAVYGLIFKSILGGNLGLVITRTGIVSRDMMEPVVYSSWEEIRTTPAAAGDKPNHIVVGEQLHIIPDQYETLTQPMIELINDIADGTVALD